MSLIVSIFNADYAVFEIASLVGDRVRFSLVLAIDSRSLLCFMVFVKVFCHLTGAHGLSIHFKTALHAKPRESLFGRVRRI